MHNLIGEGLTFDDVLLVPAYSDIYDPASAVPEGVEGRTLLKGLSLIPSIL